MAFRDSMATPAFLSRTIAVTKSMKQSIMMPVKMTALVSPNAKLANTIPPAATHFAMVTWQAFCTESEIVKIRLSMCY